MTRQEAYEVVLAAAHELSELADADLPEDEVIRDALAVLREHHAYFSRVKPGDEVWEVFNPVVGGFREHRVSKKSRTVAAVSGDGVIFLKWNRDWTFVKEQNLFPTRDAAQAECDRRNKEGE